LRGEILSVLVESAGDRPDTLVGTSARYAPVELFGDARWIGRLVRATAQAVEGGRIRCALASSNVIC
ncbi:MAG: hypothetical protein JW719_07750, partial [Pirellulales bacterium]|nr:hypothetical protein [Pirellulales bacterium]